MNQRALGHSSQLQRYERHALLHSSIKKFSCLHKWLYNYTCNINSWINMPCVTVHSYRHIKDMSLASFFNQNNPHAYTNDYTVIQVT